MEDLILNISVSNIVGLLVKSLMVLILLLSLVMVRQASLMDRVVNLPIGGNLKLLTWSFCGITCLLTVILILV